MAKAGNKYADKIFSEHPIALWPLDEQAYYYSQIDDNDRLLSNWSNVSSDRVNLCRYPSFENNATTGWGSANTIAASTDFAYYGTYSLKTTLANTADTNICYYGAANADDLIAGSYVYSAYFYIPVGSALNGKQVLISPEGAATVTNVVAPLATLIAGQWVRAYISFTVTVPNTESFVARINVNPSSYQGQVIYTDAALLERTSALQPFFDGGYGGGAWLGAANGSQSVLHIKDRINKINNPSVEVNTTGWNGNNASAAVRSTAQFVSGAASFLITYNTTTNGGAGLYIWENAGTGPGIPVTAGKTYTFSVYVRDAGATRNYTPYISWQDSDTAAGTTIANSYASPQTVTLNTWTRVTVTATAPVGAKAAIPIAYTSAGVATTAGQTAYFDSALFEESHAAYPYFDGSTTSLTYGGVSYSVSPIWQGTAHASRSTINHFTVNNSPTFNATDPPIAGEVMSSIVKSNALAGTVELQSPDLFTINTVTPSISTFTINLFMYLRPAYINSFRVGYRYYDNTSTLREVVSEDIPAPSSEGWVNFNETYQLPSAWSLLPVNMFISVNFKDSTGATADDRSFIISGLSVGQGSEATCFESTGINPITLPSELNLPDFTGWPVDQYGLSAENGYYLVKDYALLARNDGFPIIYGTDHSTKLYPSDTVGSPSLIFPGKGMLHEQGRNKYYTFEMWMKLDPLVTSAKKILGPLDSNDGLYVKEGFLTLVIGDEIGSHCVAQWYRPMLVHIILKEANATVMINGEEVISIPFNRSTVALSSLRDWWGLYTYEEFSSFYVDTISIFPYIVSNMVAKRRFVYGQGTPSAESLDTAYFGTSTQIDFPLSEYTNSVIYPDIARWDAGYFNNLVATKDYIATPNYSLPIINLGGRDVQEWYNNNYIVNTSEYPEGGHPRFITFRPNQALRKNLCTNPSFETNTTSWAAGSTGSTIVRDTTVGYFGTTSLRFYRNATDGLNQAYYGMQSASYVDPTKTYTWSVYVRSSVSRLAQPIMQWRSAAGLVRQDNGVAIDTVVGDWVRISITATPPAGCDRVRLYVNISNAVVNEDHWIDGSLYEVDERVLGYFDGSYYDNNTKAISAPYWNGTANGSTSEVMVWNPLGINYTSPSYLNFPSLNILNDKTTSVYGIFEAERDIASDRTLMSFVNIINGSTLKISLNSDEVTYSLNGTQLYSEIIPVGSHIAVGISFDEAGLNFGYDVNQFFSSPSSIQVFVGGDGVNTFEGKIYGVGFSNSSNYDMIKSSFYTSADITESTPANAVERLAQGLVKSSRYNVLISHIASYTLLPEYEYGHLFLDISVQSEWEEYFPLSYFAGYVEDKDGNLVYDLDMLQMNIGYTSIISGDAWPYSQIPLTYATYNDLDTGPFATYINLQKNSTDADVIDVSKSAIQSYLTFQKIADGANAPLSSFTYGVPLDGNTLVVDADAVSTIAVPDKAYDSVFSFRDGTIVFPPKSKPFEEYAMVVHLQINQRSIMKNPFKLRSFEITSKNFNYNAEDGSLDNRVQIGTKYGKKIYPQSDVYGGVIDHKWKNPYVIYKSSTPYIYTTKNSGIRPSRETYTDIAQPTQSEIFLPINESGAFVYKVAALQMMVKPQFKEETANVKLLEIRHRDKTLSFIANKIGDRASISVYTRSDSINIDNALPSTAAFTTEWDGGAPDSSYEQYVNANNGAYNLPSISDSEYAPISGTEFYHNGRYVGTMTLVNDEWSVVGISLPFELNFDEYETGGISLYGGFVFNNISYYQSDGLGIESTIIGRTWNGIVNDQAVTGTPPNIWQYWTGSTWEYAYVLGTDIDFSSTPEDIYDAYMGTNSLLVDDGLKISMKQKEVKIITDATWSMFSEKPA